MKTAQSTNLNIEQIVHAIQRGEMPDGSDVYKDAHLSALYDALGAFNSDEIDVLLEDTGGGVKTAEAIVEKIRRHAAKIARTGYLYGPNIHLVPGGPKANHAPLSAGQYRHDAAPQLMRKFSQAQRGGRSKEDFSAVAVRLNMHEDDNSWFGNAALPLKAYDFYSADFSFFARFVAAWRQLMCIWRDRARSRRELEMLSDRELQDAGFTRIDVENEKGKPFWKP